MTFNDIPEEILKDLIYEHLFIELDTNKSSSSDFYYQWNDKKSSIIYKDVDLVVHGKSCWEESKEVQTTSKADNYDESFFGSFFNSFLIDDLSLHKQFKNNMTDDFLYYLEHYKESYDYDTFINKSYEEVDFDSYDNYNRVRTLIINVDQILTYIKSMPFIKEITKDVFYNIPSEKLQKLILNLQFQEQFPEKYIPSKKNKI